jgi:outer membrane protein
MKVNSGEAQALKVALAQVEAELEELRLMMEALKKELSSEDDSQGSSDLETDIEGAPADPDEESSENNQYLEEQIQSLEERIEAFNAQVESLSEELAALQTEIQTKAQKYQAETTEATPENIRQRREQEINGLYERFQQAREDNARAFEQAQQEKMQPVYVAVAEAVKALAKEEGYVYIIDKQAAQGTYIFLNDTLNEDVTNKVAAKLGITLAAPAPARPVAAQ